MVAATHLSLEGCVCTLDQLQGVPSSDLVLIKYMTCF